MSGKAEIAAEELVYAVAEELGITARQRDELDAIEIAEDVLQDIRIEIKQAIGRALVIDDYSTNRPANVINIFDVAARRISRA